MGDTRQRMPTIVRLNDGQPIIEKNISHAWEQRVTFNPACALVCSKDELNQIIPHLPFDSAVRQQLQKYPALCFLLYRAQGAKAGDRDVASSSLGLAILTPDLTLLARHSEPILSPDSPYDDLGVEDGRVTNIGNLYILFYTAYGSAQPANNIRIGIASTTDFIHWNKRGLLKGPLNTINNKNGILFPGKIQNKFIMLHRPMEGADALAIHWAEADDPFGEWITRGVLMKPIPNPSFTDTWIGGGAPPLRLPDGRFLIIYHIGNRSPDGTREYDLGIAVADFSSPGIIVKRSEPVLRPETPAESLGDTELGVNNVLFICGAYFWNGDLYFPYAGADSVVLAGKIAGRELDRYLAE
ncbi:MAG TPA: glycosidase [Bacteroidota bacterium]|nr:glycosidase [Bacteroidota bacterium]